jgi:hypothetical protein
VRIDRSAAEPYTTREVLEAIGDVDRRGARRRRGDVGLEASPPKLGALVSALNAALS